MNDTEILEEIKAILDRGHDAHVQQTKSGIVVLEVQKKIRYRVTQEDNTVS